MKKRKILSLFLSFCLILGLLPTAVLAAYPDRSEAGFKLTTKSYTDGVLTVTGLVKLPTAEGISSFNVVLSWDSTVLTLLKKNDATTKYTPPTDTKKTYKLAVNALLTNGSTEEKFGVSEAELFGKDGRAGFKINLYSDGGSIEAEKTTDWVNAFEMKFEVTGKPADASTVLNSDSLRIADPVKDKDVIEGAFPANNTYTIQVQDAADPAKIYNYGKMAGNLAPETEANNFMMTAPGTGTATYPGSTNKPALPPYSGDIAAPTVNSNAGGKVVLNTVTPTAGGTVKYGYSNSASTVPTTWQDSTTFDSLTVGSTYYFYAKVEGTSSYAEKVSAASAAVPVASKAVPTITTFPTADAITYGQKLSDSNLTGGEAKVDSAVISGTFKWKTETIAPQVKDSNSTEYDVVFTPDETTSYETATCKVKLTVNPKSLTDVAVEDIAAQAYTGSQITPAVNVKGDGGKPLVKDKDYTVDYGANNTTGTGAGTVTVKAKTDGNYTFGNVVKHFDINAGSADDTLKEKLKATHTPYTGTYNGTAHNAFTADMSSVTGWTATYSRTETGTYGSMPTVENVADSGNIYVKFSHASYADVIAEYEVKITQKSISDMLVTLDHDSFAYDGTDKTVAVTSVKTTDGAVTLTPTSDYTIDSGSTMTAKNVPEGAGYPVVVAGTGNYTGTHTVYWKITKADPNATDFDIPSLSAPVDYTGDPISVTPPTLKTGKTDAGAVTVYYAGAAASGTTYSKSTTAPTNVGTYDVTFDVAEGTNFKAASDLTYGTLTIQAKNVSETRSAENQTVVKDVGDFTPPTFGAVTGTLTYTYDGGTKTYEEIKAALAAKAAGDTATIGYSYAADGNYAGTITGTINVTVVDVVFEVSGVTATVGNTLTVKADPTYGDDWSKIVKIKDGVTITAKVGTNTDTVQSHFTLKQTGKPGAGSQAYTLSYNGTINGVTYSDVTVVSGNVDVAQKEVTVSGITANSKSYDGSDTATVDASGATFAGIVIGDTLTITPTGAFTDANVGENKTVTLTLGSLSGASATNYTLDTANSQTEATADITARDVTVTGITATSRPYAKDNLKVDLTGGTVVGAVTGEDVTVDLTNAKGMMTNANAGTNKAVNITGVVLGGADKDNYNLTAQPSGVTVDISKIDHPDYGTTQADNTNALRTTAGTKTYNLPCSELAGVTYAVTGKTTANIVADDAPTIAENVLTYTSKVCTTANATDTITIKIASTNYNDIILTLTVTATDKAPVTISGLTYADKTYDGNAITHTGTLTVSDNRVPVDELEVLYTSTDVAGYSAVTAPKDAGAYKVEYKVADSNPNYTGSASYTFTISKKAATVAPKAVSITKGSAIPIFELVYTGLVNGETLTPDTVPAFSCFEADGTTPVSTSTAAGSYTITWTNEGTTTFTGAGSTNYTVTKTATATLTISNPSYSGGGSYTPSYSITVDKTENGTITVSPKSASKGDTVTITVKPDKGYELEMLKALDKDGDALKLTEKNGKYTFKMPSGKVTVKGSFVEEAPEQIFKDVPVDAYYYEAVKWAAEKGITGGVGNGLFAPNQPCTRAQIVTFLWRAAGSPDPKNMSSFADVPADAFYAKAVAWAVENGITGGTGDGKFSPDATCTRAQAVTFLYRASGAPAVSGNAAFSDVATNAYYAAAVKWAEKNGITGGIGGGLFGSNNDCTRAHIVTFLYRSVK
mgnify:CR=1 FL=1